MSRTRAIVVAVYVSSVIWVASALALPPQNSPWQANYAQAMYSCVNQCLKSGALAKKYPGLSEFQRQQLCANECNNLAHPNEGVGSPDAGRGGPCSLETQIAMDAWYGICVVDLAVLTQGGSPLVQGLANIIGNAQLAGILVSKAVGLADPCGYVKQQVLNGC
jgi:hypothetical protein